MSVAIQSIVCAILGIVHGSAISGLIAPSWALQIVSLSAGIFAFVNAAQARTSRVLLLASAFYIASFWIGLGWLDDALVRQATLGVLLGSMLFLLIVLAVAAFPVLVLSASIVATRRIRFLALRALGCAASLALAEYWRGEVTGFPWLAPGYAQVESPLAGLFPLLGIHGVGLVIAIIACAIALLGAHAVRRDATRSDVLSIASLAFITVAVVVLARQRDEGTDSPAVHIKLLQTQLSLDEKFSPNEYQRYVGKIGAWVEANDANRPTTAIITPETLIPSPWYQLSKEWQRTLLDAAARSSGTIVLGMLDHDESFGFVNRTVLLKSAPGQTPRLDSITYTKRTLVPLGEYAPPGFGWIVDLLALPASQRSPGPPGQSVLKMDGLVIKPSICLDALAPNALQVDEDFDVLANQANLSWFPGEKIREQFWLALRARALELDKPVIASANTGPSGAIDADGRTILRVPSGAEGMFAATIEPRRGITPYARYGDALFLWLCATAVIIAFTPAILRRVRPRGST
jgi:apolipoprotein N-acyltransferase